MAIDVARVSYFFVATS